MREMRGRLSVRWRREDFWAIGARNAESGVVARCRREEACADRDRRVGQDEIDIVRLADCVLVVMVPGLGG